MIDRQEMKNGFQLCFCCFYRKGGGGGENRVYMCRKKNQSMEAERERERENIHNIL